MVPGTEYPAVLFTVFESDTRVDPLHARKMCAALQHATSGDPVTRPILLRRETDVGHGARSISRTVALATDQLAFLAAHTGLDAVPMNPTQLLPARPACADDAGSWCAQLYELTSNDFLSRSADTIVSGTLPVALIVVLARAGPLPAAPGDLPGDRGRDRRAGVPAGEPSAGAGSGRRRGRAAARSEQRARTIGSVLRSIASAVVAGRRGDQMLAEFNVNLAPILASAGIVGLAVGFGAQNLVRDFLSGMFMLLEDQYGVGDIVDVGEATGTVEAVGLRITTLRDGNGTVWYVRNGEILRVGNKSQGYAIAVVDLPVAPHADIAAVTALLGRVAADRVAEPDIADDVLEPPEVLGVERVAADGRDPAAHRAGQPGQAVRRAAGVERGHHLGAGRGRACVAPVGCRSRPRRRRRRPAPADHSAVRARTGCPPRSGWKAPGSAAASACWAGQLVQCAGTSTAGAASTSAATVRPPPGRRVDGTRPARRTPGPPRSAAGRDARC